MGLPGRVLPAIWPGLLVLSAHLIDLVEWTLTATLPESFTSHQVTHSPVLTGATLAGALTLLGLIFRPRSPVPYLLVAVAVLSHIPLDMLSFREGLARLYGVATPDDGPPGLRASLTAEAWLFGLLFVAVTLTQAALHPRLRPATRRFTWVLLGLSVIAALTRVAVVWAPFYVIALTHGFLVRRSDYAPRLLWSLVPVLPLLLLLAVEVRAARTESQALRLQTAGRLAEALALHRQALAAPARSSKTGIYVHMSLCYRDLGDYRQAEECLLRAEMTSELPEWPRVTRAQLYVYPKTRGTPFFRPEVAERILSEMRDSGRSKRYAEIARFHIDRLRRQGILPPG